MLGMAFPTTLDARGTEACFEVYFPYLVDAVDVFVFVFVLCELCLFPHNLCIGRRNVFSKIEVISRNAVLFQRTRDISVMFLLKHVC